LIRCRRRPAIAASLPATKPALTCVFCPESDARMAARSSRRVVTRTSVDGGAHPVHTPKQSVEQGFPPRGARRPVMTATGLVVTDVSHLDVGLDIRGGFRGPVRFAVSSKPSRPARRQSVPPQVMRRYNHPSRLCAASSRASHNSMPGLQPARSRWASAAIPSLRVEARAP
jgi:hypothetical protein